MSADRLRRALGAAGLLFMAVGAFEVLAHLGTRLPALVLWLALPLVGHDFFLVPVTLAAAWAVRRVLPRPWWGPVVIGVVVSAGLLLVTAAAEISPATGTVPGLLDRHYGRGLLISLVITWVVVVAARGLLSRRAEVTPP